MKVLGMVNSKTYLAEVTHTELEKLSGNYYGNLPSLNVGEEMDLGAGYNFTSDIKKVCHAMTDAMKAFESAQSTMRSFAIMVSALPEQKQITS